MSAQRWTWRYLPKPGADVSGVPACPAFASQGDAESWVGEEFQQLFDAGVEKVVLDRDGTDVYTMGLAAE